MLKYTQNVHGSVSILAMIVMLLLLTIGASMLAVSSSDVTATGSYRDGLTAQYAAELGVKQAIYQLNYDATVLANVKNLSSSTPKYTMLNINSLSAVIPNVTYAVNYFWVDDSTRRIEAVGTVNGKVKRRATLLVNLSSGTNPIFDKYVTYAGGTVTINSSSVITGNVGAQGTVTQNGGTINGNIGSSSGYTHYGGTLTGTWTDKPDDTTVPATLPAFISFDSSIYSSGTALSGSIYGGGTKTLSGLYYVNGDFQMGSTTFNVSAGSSATIYATGNIILNSGTVINGNITLIAGGSGKKSGNIQINGATISAPNGTVNLNANGSFYHNSNSLISSSNVAIEAVSDIQLNGSPIKVDDNGTIKMYTKSRFYFNSNSVITGDCLIMSNGDTEINGGVGKRTIFIAGGNIAVNSNSDVGQVYAVKNFANNGGKVTYNKDLAQKLIANSGSGTVTLNFNSWGNH